MIDFVIELVKDTAKKAVNKARRKDGIVVLVQASDGRQYIFGNQYFTTKRGRTIAEKGHLEFTSRAIRRVMRYVKKSISPQDYEIDTPSYLGPNRKYFVVWFPSHNEFSVSDDRWRGAVGLLTEVSSELSRTHKKKIKATLQKTGNLRRERIAQAEAAQLMSV